jgi:crotonobetainyl-CoA:carnitine CoA-transferase CaiB-like acyl-CoA transferase
MNGPMRGVRVVELAQWISAPATAAILADWGAEIFKVEPINGDPFRWIFTTGATDAVNVLFEFDNRGKRSLAIDVSKDDGRQLLIDLIKDADVFLTNMRPQWLEKCRIDFDTLAAEFPRLIYASITGYGSNGEQRDRQSYDIGGFWARSGLAFAHTVDGGAPPTLRGACGDHTTGMTLTAGVAAALFERERTGRGQHVTTSLLRTGMYILSQDITMSLRLGGSLPMGGPREAAGNPMMNSYCDRDGRWFWLLGLQPDRMWPSAVRAVDRPEWLDDERFNTLPARRQNARVLVQLLDEIFATKPRDEWAEIFTREEVWWEPVMSPDEVIADPQVAAAGAFIEGPTPDGMVTMLNTPIDFSDSTVEPERPCPMLGEHTDELLLELGYDWDRIVELKLAGIVL